ncbi:MAG: SGNH/GDSL hydrolase family protein [Aeromicrobium sp.]
MPRRAASLVALLAAGLLVLTGCRGEPEIPAEPVATGAYVALGDSYVSGPLIDVQDPTSPACLRSDEHNYPSLVAKELGVSSFVDVSCGGETTAMLKDGRTFDDGTVLGPQLDAVTSRTTLVTLGIGGNDGDAAAGLFNYCLIPASASDRSCDTFISDYMPKVYDRTRDDVTSIVRQIRKRAPRAEVVMTGYLRIAPEQGDCAALPLSSIRRKATLAWEAGINDALRDVAERTEARFVDVRGISRGHDACAGDEAWVNGVGNSPDGDGAFLHPTAAGMEQVARLVVKAVRAG